MLARLRKLLSLSDNRATMSLSREDRARTAEAVGKHLERGLPALESAFLEIGQCLEPLSDGSQRLVEQCGTLLHLASGRTDGRDLLHDTLAILEGPLACIDQCLGRRERLLALLAECEGQTDTLLSARDSLHDILAPLAHLTVFFRIESARLPLDMRETFTTVTLEIERMRHMVDETFESNAKLLTSARSTISSVRHRLEADFGRHAREMAGKRTQIDTAIRTLDSQLSHNDERDLRLHNQSRSICNEVSRMVESLQFQDIIQQRCTHITKALTSPEFLANPAAARLQASQLDSVCTDLAKGGESIGQALEHIRLECDRFDELALKLDGLEGMVAASDGMIQHLLEVITAVDSILRVLNELTAHANQALEPLRNLTTTFSSAVVELSINMRLIALNAQIRAVHCGEGTGLEVLAARTAEISRLTTEATTSNFAQLQTLRDSVAEMLDSFGAFYHRGHEELDRFTDTRQAVENRLHEMRDRTLSAFSDISITIETLRNANTKIGDARTGLVPVREHLGRAAADLHSLDQRYPAPSTATDTKPAAATAAAVVAPVGYTMASEYAVHAAVHGTEFKAADTAPELFFDAPPSDSAPAASTAPELFGDEPSTPAAPAPELFDDAPPPPPTNGENPPPPPKRPTPPEAAPPSLGDNVELF